MYYRTTYLLTYLCKKIFLDEYIYKLSGDTWSLKEDFDASSLLKMDISQRSDNRNLSFSLLVS